MWNVEISRPSDREEGLPMKYLLLSVAMLLLALSSYSQERFLVKIRLDQKENFSRLADMNLDLASELVGQTVDAVVTGEELLEIGKRGFVTDILPFDPPGVNVTQYRSYEEVVELLNYYAMTYDRIVRLDTLGYSQVWNLLIPALKISDNPELEEDEPSILFDGLHHAREPVGMYCTLYVLERLLRNYGLDPEVTAWVNDNEVWVIPMINPEGYKYLVDNNLSSPWWRKNLRDNNQNGIVDPGYDGVDLNRNYAWGWLSGGSSNPGDWVYRGPSPFSEKETDAKRDWATVQKPVLSITYHSYGEQVLYTWSEEPRSPDHDLIVEIGDSIAGRIPKNNGTGHYSVDPSECTTGYSKCWMYGKLGTIEYTVETADQFVPPFSVGMKVAQDNLAGALYLFDRIKGPGITGHILDGETGLPLVARIRTLELPEDRVQPRMSEPDFGRFWRLLQPGSYTIEISKTNYITQTHAITVPAGRTLVEMNIVLQPVTSGIGEISLETGRKVCTGARIFPNPFSQAATIEFDLTEASPVAVTVTDLLGRIVNSLYQGELPAGRHLVNWQGNHPTGSPVRPGLYLVLIETRGGISRLTAVKE